MKTTINKLFFASSMILSTACITACVDDNKDLYDPSYQTPNPMEDISAPAGFDWSSTNSIKFSVEVDDEFDGQYYYTVEILDKNPLEATAEDPYNTLAKGVAKKGEALSDRSSVFQGYKVSLCPSDRPTWQGPDKTSGNQRINFPCSMLFYRYVCHQNESLGSHQRE